MPGFHQYIPGGGNWSPVSPAPQNFGIIKSWAKTTLIKAYTMEGIPPSTPRITLIPLPKKPSVNSEANMAIAKETGTAIPIDTTTTKKVPHIPGIMPNNPPLVLKTPEM
jgi:hypothetical protein